jgi:hypothetical protein
MRSRIIIAATIITVTIIIALLSSLGDRSSQMSRLN